MINVVISLIMMIFAIVSYVLREMNSFWFLSYLSIYQLLIAIWMSSFKRGDD